MGRGNGQGKGQITTLRFDVAFGRSEAKSGTGKGLRKRLAADP
jgi:hypothetical protein